MKIKITLNGTTYASMKEAVNDYVEKTGSSHKKVTQYVREQVQNGNTNITMPDMGMSGGIAKPMTINGVTYETATQAIRGYAQACDISATYATTLVYKELKNSPDRNLTLPTTMPRGRRAHRPVVIDGVSYRSIRAASQALAPELGTSPGTIANLILSSDENVIDGFVEKFLSERSYKIGDDVYRTREQALDALVERYPKASRSSINTHLNRGENPELLEYLKRIENMADFQTNVSIATTPVTLFGVTYNSINIASEALYAEYGVSITYIPMLYRTGHSEGVIEERLREAKMEPRALVTGRQTTILGVDYPSISEASRQLKRQGYNVVYAKLVREIHAGTADDYVRSCKIEE